MKYIVPALSFVLAVGSPAVAQWEGGAAQQAAATYCANRAAGQTHKQATDAVSRVLAGSTRSFATVMFSGGEMVRTTGYIAQQMCPEYFQ
jgi:hypothetical protein